MLPPESLKARILEALPDARIEVDDLTGTRDHYAIVVESAAFVGMSRLAQQRLVYAALAEEMRGPIHALALTTRAPNPQDAAERT